MIGSDRLVAIEEHWLPADLAAALDGRDVSLALNRRGDLEHRLADLADLADGRLATMDAQGIDLAVLSLTPPGTQALDPADAVRFSRAANDTAAAAVARHPDRFRALASLPLSAPGEAVTELERAADLGHVGVMVHGHAGPLHLDDPVHDDVFAAAARRRMPVFLHPQLPPDLVRDGAYRGFDAVTDLGLATFGWGWHVDAATSALRLILRGTFERHPDLHLVLGHWGELLLFWLDRVDGLARPAGLSRSVSETVRTNVHVTTSGMLDPVKLRHVLEVTTPDRLLFSTDYPFHQPTRAEITAFCGHIPAADRAGFTSGNATALFGLDPAGGH